MDFLKSRVYCIILVWLFQRYVTETSAELIWNLKKVVKFKKVSNHTIISKLADMSIFYIIMFFNLLDAAKNLFVFDFSYPECKIEFCIQFLTSPKLPKQPNVTRVVNSLKCLLYIINESRGKLGKNAAAT